MGHWLTGLYLVLVALMLGYCKGELEDMLSTLMFSGVDYLTAQKLESYLLLSSSFAIEPSDT